MHVCMPQCIFACLHVCMSACLHVCVLACWHVRMVEYELHVYMVAGLHVLGAVTAPIAFHRE